MQTPGAAPKRWSDISWHTLPSERVLALLGSARERGLPETEAEERLREFGRNVLTAAKKISPWELFWVNSKMFSSSFSSWLRCFPECLGT